MTEGAWSFLMLGVALGSVGALLLRVVVLEGLALLRDLTLLREIFYGDGEDRDHKKR